MLLALEVVETLLVLEPFEAVEALVLGPLPAPEESADSPQPTNAAPAASPDKNWRRVGCLGRCPEQRALDLCAIVRLHSPKHTAHREKGARQFG